MDDQQITQYCTKYNPNIPHILKEEIERQKQFLKQIKVMNAVTLLTELETQINEQYNKNHQDTIFIPKILEQEIQKRNRQLLVQYFQFLNII